jgi:anti-anti-sigma factor
MHLFHAGGRAMSEPQQQHLKAALDQGVLVLTVLNSQLHGDALAESIRQEALDMVEQTGATRVAVDLRFVKSMSSAAFRPLLSLRRRLQELNGRLVLCGMNPDIAHVFQVTRLVGTGPSAPFVSEPDTAAAIARLRQEG